MAAGERGAAVEEFLEELPPQRRPEVERVREVILKHLPAGYEEAISKKALVYQVPLERFSKTYNRQPLWYVGIAAEKSYISLHLVPVYALPSLAERLREGFAAAGKKLDMGKGCVRFQKADDLDLQTIGEIVASLPVDRWVELTEAARSARQRPSARSSQSPDE